MKLGFITEGFGNISEIWMWRQFLGMSALEPKLYTWQYQNKHLFPLSEKDVTIAIESHTPRGFFEKRYVKIYKRISGNHFAYPGGWKNINKWIESEKIDKILCHFGYTGLKILPLAKKKHIPMACHFHGYDLNIALHEDKRYRDSLMKNIQKFDALIVVGTHQFQRLLDYNVPEKKIHLIPCGVPCELFNYKRRDNKDTVSFIAVSRLVPIKRIFVSIKAFQLVNKHIKCKLKIIGGGVLFDEIKNYISENNLSDCVFLMGELNSNDVIKYLYQSDIFIQHSEAEGFGVSVAEAASTGLPVVCPDSPGLRDQVINNETGYLVPQEDVIAMAEKMLLLAKDKTLRDKMGLAGHNRMKNNYDTTKQIQKLEKVLLEM